MGTLFSFCLNMEIAERPTKYEVGTPSITPDFWGVKAGGCYKNSEQ